MKNSKQNETVNQPAQNGVPYLSTSAIGILELPPAGDRSTDLQDDILGLLENAGISPAWSTPILALVAQAETATLFAEALAVDNAEALDALAVFRAAIEGGAP